MEPIQSGQRLAAIYARVSSERQRKEQTIDSQLVELRELAAERGLIVSAELVFCDEGISGATLVRPALERLRDAAFTGAFEVLLCHAPDRLARRYAYQVLLLEELERCGVEVSFAHEPQKSDSPEDELLRQFRGVIAEYERAQIAERTRRGKLHRARQGAHSVLGTAPYGYRLVRAGENIDAYLQIDPAEAQIVREIFKRYLHGGHAIGRIARDLGAEGITTRKGLAHWDRSTVWGILRNPAYRGQAAFGRHRLTNRPTRPMRATRMRGERTGRESAREHRAPEDWIMIDVPAIIEEHEFALAEERMQENKRFSTRNTKHHTLLQGLVICGGCGYACCRATVRRKRGATHYYRCIGSGGHPVRGRLCTSRRVRAEELDGLVWAEVCRLLREPELVRTELRRRLEAARREHPATHSRAGLERELARARASTTRLIEAYQEQLLTLDDLRERMPALRTRERTITAQLQATDAEVADTETYLKLAESLDEFTARLDAGLDELTLAERQRIVRLLVREVVLHDDGERVTIKHSIPLSPRPPTEPRTQSDRLRVNHQGGPRLSASLRPGDPLPRPTHHRCLWQGQMQSGERERAGSNK